MVRRLLVVITLSLIVLGFPKFAFSIVEGIVAVVNDEVVTQKDVNEFASLMYLQHSDEYKDRKELEQEIQKWRQEAVQRIIEDRLIVQEAKRQKIAVVPEMVENRVKEIKKQFPSTEAFENTLIAEGLTVNDLKRKISEQLMMREIVKKEIEDKIFVSPTEVTAYYEGHKDKILMPEQLNVDSIFMPFKDSAGVARSNADKALVALKKGEDFSQVAKKYSYSPSIGKVAKGELRKDIEDAVFKLKKGEFSSVMRTENGFYIFRLIDILPSKQLELNEVRNQIYRYVFAEKFERQFSDWMEGLKKQAYIYVK